MHEQMQEASPIVDFIGIGAAKSGTTWLADCLRFHPEIFIPKNKELDYFNEIRPYYGKLANKNYGRPLSWFHHFFAEKTKTQIAGELSPAYLNTQGTAQAIYKYNPDVKIIVLLRNPLEQLQSLYLFFLQKGFIKPASFEETIFSNDEMLDGCFYYKHLKSYFDLFPKSQIKVAFYDDLVADRKAFFLDILKFLEVSDYIPPNFGKRSNVTTKSISPRFNYLLDKARILLHKKNALFLLRLLRKTGITKVAEWLRDTLTQKKLPEKPSMKLETQKKILALVKDDVDQLSQYVNRDLEHWLQVKTNR